MVGSYDVAVDQEEEETSDVESHEGMDCSSDKFEANLHQYKEDISYACIDVRHAWDTFFKSLEL
jgi:hypothetical protein